MISVCASEGLPGESRHGPCARPVRLKTREMSDTSKFRTTEDLERVIRAIAREFVTDTVFIIGSQAVLMSWPDAPGELPRSTRILATLDNGRSKRPGRVRTLKRQSISMGCSVTDLRFISPTGSISMAWMRRPQNFRGVGASVRSSVRSMSMGDL